MLLEKIYLSFMSKLVHLECSYGVRCGAGHRNPCSLWSIIVRPSLVFLVCTHTVRKDPQLPLSINRAALRLGEMLAKNVFGLSSSDAREPIPGLRAPRVPILTLTFYYTI